MKNQFKKLLIYTLIAASLSSCAKTINLTQAQKEQKKLGRFRVTPSEHIAYSISAFVSLSLANAKIKKK